MRNFLTRAARFRSAIGWAHPPSAGHIAAAELNRYIGYWQPYATNHDELDADAAIQEEVRNAARTLFQGVQAIRSGDLVIAGQNLTQPRQK